MESIDKLREYVENVSRMSISLMARATLLGMVRDIECEVADMVSLPVDADGVPIHARDMLDGYGKTIEVVEMRYGRSGWVLISGPGNAYADCAAFTHHHAPTVEDVLAEMVAKVIVRGELTNGAAQTIAEFAAKLRLAEGEDA